MIKIFTPLLQVVLFVVICSILAFAPNGLYAQCSSSTPLFEVDLSGKPNGVWTSPSVNRNGQCCNAASNEKCVQFSIILDKLSGGLQFDITSGPMPAGAMSYQVGCGTKIPVGDSICVTGTGPHILTICMPGNASNGFTIRSIAAYEPVADASVTVGCSQTLNAPIAFDPASVSWNDITGGGSYNKYLSCTSGCATTTVTPDANAPAFVDYVVCGNSQSAVCSSIPYCDTVRVHFYAPIEVSISPDPAIICPGSTGVVLSGDVKGGSGVYNYYWTNSSGTIVATTKDYTATSVGKYFLEVRNENYPNCSTRFIDEITVTNTLAVNAGPDQQVCSQNAIQLSGTVLGATGGIWSGGGGTYSPGHTDLKAVYTPTAAEVAAGTVTLTLTSTGNGSCTAVSDQVRIILYPFSVLIDASETVCKGSTATLTATPVRGVAPFTYKWSTGETSKSITGKSAGTYSVTVTDSKGCTSQTTATVTEVVGPTDLIASAKASTCGSANGEITVSQVTGGTSPYTYSKDGTNYQTSATLNGLTAGSYTITVKDANGCTVSKAVSVTNISGPTAVTATAKPASCKNNDGSIEVGTVTGGTSPYTYSVDGSSYQTSKAFSGLAAATYTITAKDANGCLISTTASVGTNVITDLTATAKSSTCSGSNGELTISSVSGGTGPYTYSKDGANFQASATFNQLKAGVYVLTVKDVNGCTYSKPATVGDIPGPSDFTISTKPSTCGNSNGTITIDAVTGGTSPYSYSLDGTIYQTGTTFNNLIAKEYNVWVKDTNGCTYSKKVEVKNIPGPSDYTATTKSSTCGNANGAITVSAVTGGTSPYSYSKDGNTYQTSNTFAGLTAGSYTITVKDANGCTFAKSLELKDIPGPSDMIISSIPSTCGYANAEIKVVSVTAGTSPYSYSLNGGAYQTSHTFSRVQSGNYQISVKDANGCTLSKNVVVENIPGPTDAAVSTKSSTCGDSNGEITVSGVTGGTSPYSYSITGTVFQNSATFTALLSGTYRLTVKDANGCTYAEEVVLRNLAGATDITASTTPSSCTVNDGTITVSSVVGGTSPYVYSLDGATYRGASIFTGLAPADYLVWVKDGNGCTTSFPIKVKTNGPTAAEVRVVSAACGKADGSITVNTVTAGTSPYVYSLDGSTFQSAATFSGLAAGTYTITIKDAKACILSLSRSVSNAGGVESFSIVAKDESCDNNNGSIQISNVMGGTSPYAYSVDGGITFQAESSFTSLSEGTFQVAVKDANGCLLFKTQTLNNNPAPTAVSFSTLQETCGEKNGSLTVKSVSGGTAPYSYSIDGATFQEATTFSGLAAGSYQLTVRDQLGCTVTEAVTIDGIKGPAAVDFTTKRPSCYYKDGEITITEVIGGTSPYWYSLDGTNYQTFATFTGLDAGIYTLIVRDANNCSISTKAIIEKPGAELAIVQDVSCYGEADGKVVIRIIGDRDLAEFSLDGGLTYQKDSVFNNLQGGTYAIMVKLTAECTITLEDIIIREPGQIKAVVMQTAMAIGLEANGSAEISKVEGGTGPYTYTVDGVAYGNYTNIMQLSEGEHKLLVRDAKGCEEIILFTIEGISELEIPNGFTPNGDGFNDKWVMKNLHLLYPTCKVAVYNRWGSPIFQSSGYANEWNGTYNGKSLPDGTYYYTIQLNATEKPLKGTVTIMR